jgi:hypothetical protein
MMPMQFSIAGPVFPTEFNSGLRPEYLENRFGFILVILITGF